MKDSGEPDFNPGWLSRTRLPFLAVLHRLMPSAVLRGLGTLRDLNTWLTIRVQSFGRSILRPSATRYEYRSRRRKKQRAAQAISPDENELGEQDREESEPVEDSDWFSPSLSREETLEQPSRHPVAPELADYPSLAPIHTIDLTNELEDSRTASSENLEWRLQPVSWNRRQYSRLKPPLQNQIAISYSDSEASVTATEQEVQPSYSFARPSRSVTTQSSLNEPARVAPSPDLEAFTEAEIGSVTTTASKRQAFSPISGELRLNVRQADGDWLVTKTSEQHDALPAVGFTHRRNIAATPMQIRSSIASDILRSESPSVESKVASIEPAEERVTRSIVEDPNAGRAIPVGGQASAQSVTASIRQDWPVLDLIRRDDRATAPEKRLPIQILQSPSAMSALQTLPTLGPGEPLTEPVKPLMEKLVGRDLSRVRVYSSPAAEAMGAEAFTTGDRVVFAPGRMDLKSNQGLALLGHELAHVGQPLGMKQWDGAFDVSDRNEHAARQQESAILREFEQQQQPPPRMELRTATSQAHTFNQESNNSINGEMVVETNPPVFTSLPEITMPERATENIAPPNTSFSATATPSEAIAPIRAASSSPSAAPDVHALARQVYALLKNELRAERERHEIYRR